MNTSRHHTISQRIVPPLLMPDCVQTIIISSAEEITGLLGLLLPVPFHRGAGSAPGHNLWNGPQRRPVQHEVLLIAVQAAGCPHSPQDQVICCIGRVSNNITLRRHGFHILPVSTSASLTRTRRSININSPRPVRICHHPWPSSTADHGSSICCLPVVRWWQKMLSMFQRQKPAKNMRMPCHESKRQ